LDALLEGDLETLRQELEQFRTAEADAARLLRDLTGALDDGISELPALRQLLGRLRGDLRQLSGELAAGGGAGAAFSHLSGAYGRIAALSTQLWTVLDRLDSLELSAQFSEQSERLRTVLTALGERSAELPALLGTLEGLLAQLSQGQLDAALAFGEASRQLAQAQSQLQSAEAQYEQARAQALERANMDELLSAATLSKLIYAQNFSMPAGYVDDAEDHSWLLRVGDEYDSQEDIAGTLLADIDGVGPVRLADIADITLIDNALDSYARLNGEGGIMLCIYKGSTAGTNAVSRSCQKAMAELRERDGALRLVRLLDQGKYITIIINSILNSMLLGALLAVAVLALFLRDLRPTFVVALSIPLSVLFALVLMYFTGLSLNMMTLSGLALGIGMLVDNSIVVLENIVRLRARGLAAPRAAVQGTKQVAGAIVASTLTTVSVFFPIVFTNGTVRDMLLPLSLTVSYCLAASLLVAVTLIPASTSTLLRRVQPRPNRLMERIQRRYGFWLRWCLKHKALALLASVALLAVSLLRLLSIGIVILPDFTGDSVNVTVTMPEDADRAAAYRSADRVMERLLELEGIDSVGIMDSSSVVSSVGITTGASSRFGSFICYVTVPEGTSSGTLRRLCREAEERCADLDCTVTAQTSQMMDFTSFTSSGLSVAVSGADLERLTDIAAQVADIIRDVEGFGAVSDGSEDAGDTLRLRIDKDKAMEYGLTVAQIYAEIATRLQTSVRSTTITANGLEMTVTVSDETDLLTREKLLDLAFTPVSLGGEALGEGLDALNQGGEGETEAEQSTTHRLGEFAWLEETRSPSTIRRSDLSRQITVSAETLPGYNTTVLSRALAPRLEELSSSLPHGYSIRVGGESEQVNDMIAQMALLAGLGLLLIYLIMVAQFQSLLSPFIILFTVPLAFTGGMLALLVAGRQLTMLDIMGFLILMGTVVNNGIVFVDYANRLRLGGLPKREALVVTGQTRMRPILMTTLTTILAMALLIFGDDMGSELGGGMATVITGGLLYATLMTLFIIPILYDILYRRQPHVVDVGEDLDEEQDDAAEYLAKLEQGQA
ncbi:MAG: efflux RND transporter permease subunit, partial [Oscillospiraceae bacterium]|nr:efflux RND transporter permease subunit [Oscillospiraceae bacterium]